MRSQRDCTKSIRSSTDSSSNPGGGEGIGLDMFHPCCKSSISQVMGSEHSGLEQENELLAHATAPDGDLF